MAVCVRMVGQELRACVQYRPPLQCSRQRCTGPRRRPAASMHARAPTTGQAASQLLFPPSRHFTNQTSIVNSIETAF